MLVGPAVDVAGRHLPVPREPGAGVQVSVGPDRVGVAAVDLAGAEVEEGFGELRAFVDGLLVEADGVFELAGLLEKQTGVVEDFGRAFAGVDELGLEVEGLFEVLAFDGDAGEAAKGFDRFGFFGEEGAERFGGAGAVADHRDDLSRHLGRPALRRRRAQDRFEVAAAPGDRADDALHGPRILRSGLRRRGGRAMERVPLHIIAAPRDT